MSWLSAAKPDANYDCPADVKLVILPRTVDIGNFEIHRALPFKSRRMVGPFIFWEQVGPGDMAVTNNAEGCFYLLKMSIKEKSTSDCEMRYREEEILTGEKPSS